MTATKTGPWQPVILGHRGQPTSIDDALNDPDKMHVDFAVTRQASDGHTADVVRIDFDGDDCSDEWLQARWAQAQAMAAGLNRAAGEVAR